MTARESKIIDLTPTWEQWLHTVFTVALHTKPTAGIELIEKCGEDFKNMAKLADMYIETQKAKDNE
jgi:hypothetical protein